MCFASEMSKERAERQYLQEYRWPLGSWTRWRTRAGRWSTCWWSKTGWRATTFSAATETSGPSEKPGRRPSRSRRTAPRREARAASNDRGSWRCHDWGRRASTRSSCPGQSFHPNWRRHFWPKDGRSTILPLRANQAVGESFRWTLTNFRERTRRSWRSTTPATGWRSARGRLDRPGPGFWPGRFVSCSRRWRSWGSGCLSKTTPTTWRSPRVTRPERRNLENKMEIYVARYQWSPALY